MTLRLAWKKYCGNTWQLYNDYLMRYVHVGNAVNSLLCWTMAINNVDVDVDVVDLRAQADASMPASNNNVSYTVYSNF